MQTTVLYRWVSEKNVTSVRKQWSYVFLAPTHRYNQQKDPKNILIASDAYKVLSAI